MVDRCTKRRKVAAISKFLSMVTDDMLVEIFVRLPDSRSAVQCSSVCKRWYDLIIQNPKFINKFIHHHHQRQLIHHSKSPRPYSLLFVKCTFFVKQLCYYDSQRSRLIYEKSKRSSARVINFLYRSWLILGSCSDLLLLWSGKKYYLFNPITKKYFELPYPPPGFGGFLIPSGLVCRSDTFDTTRYEYKVVMYHLFNAAIFSSETGQWIVSPISFPKGITLSYGFNSVVCNGVLYWLYEEKWRIFKGIAAIDPFKNVDDEDRCFSIALPVPSVDASLANMNWMRIGACQDKLRFSFWLKRKKGCFDVKIWELDAAFKSWNLVHQFALRRADTDTMNVIAFHPNDADVIFVLCDHDFCQYEICKRQKKFQRLGRWPFCVAHHHWGPLATVCPLVHPLWPSPIPPAS